MTAIVGLIDGEDVLIGGDGCVSFGQFTMPSKQPKVFRVGEVIIGVAGSPRVGQLIQTSHRLEALRCPPETDAYKWLCLDFVTTLQELLREHNILRTDDGAADSRCHVLFGLRGRLFYMDGVFGIYESLRGYEAAGSSCEVAIGSLITSKRLQLGTAHERVLWALEAASEIISGVSPPFTILTSEAKEQEIPE